MQQWTTFIFDAHVIVQSSYFKYHNPLGIVDETVKRIQDFIPLTEDTGLEGLYENMCIAYRFLHGNNQLEIVWDGRTQEEHYADQWRVVYKQWLTELCKSPSFLKLFLVLTIFRHPDKNYMILENRLKGAVNHKFDLKIRSRKISKAS